MKKYSLIHVCFEKKFLLVFRLLMIVVALCFLWPIYNAINDGYVTIKGSKWINGQMSFYTYIIKYFVIAALFIWLGAGGARKKESDDKTD
jgi:hypothetical protein